MTNPSVEELTDALREQLVYLWSDLYAAHRVSRATPPEQSIGCLVLIERIHRATRLVGPTPADQVPVPFLLDGLYERVHAQMGLTVTVPEKTLQSARRHMAKRAERAAR